MNVVRLMADDLTGALDSAAPFCGRSGPVPVLLRPDAVWPAGSFALDLACREGSEAVAAARTAATAGLLSGADIAFKKIDSLLRGHWAAELAILAERKLFRQIVLAPAFPAQGRITRHGRQHVQDAEGRWQPLDIDPVHVLAQRGLPARRGFCQTGPDDTSVLICDAATDADLADIVRSARTRPGPTLYCGTAGLAGALAGALPPRVAPPSGSHLVIVGSNHRVTQGQMARLAARHPDWLVHFDGDAAASVARIDQALARLGRCVASARLPPGVAPAEAAETIATWLHGIMPKLSRPAALTVVGGETFAALCTALEVGRLVVQGAWRPGVPASHMDGGLWAGTSCFSKSGAFGTADDLIDLLADV